ncbi:MAG TPA: TonB-dependent receptor plug domain-containing protein, partial [Nitrospiraceae bacterium]|nr:TonB-dependent receptor plug domain-containing protein [Nitrospiraceae bacterium]
MTRTCVPVLRSRVHRALAGTIALLSGTGIATAQEDTAPDSPLGEVVVTAEFREASVQETPIAITAVNAEGLEARSQTSIEQVAAQAPSVHLGPQGQANGSGLIAFIRGVGQTDFNFALEPGVGLYIDDVYYPTLTGSLVDLMDLERVEILRGPQGTLAGRNSIGGAIKLFSKKPVGDGGSVSLTYGKFERTDVRGTADFALVPDKLFARIAGVTKSRDGYVERVDYGCSHPGSGVPSLNVGMGCSLGTLGGVSYTAGRVSLRYLASDAIEFNLIGDITNDSSEAGADVLRRANIGNGTPTTADDGVSSWMIAMDDGNPATPVVPYDCRFVPYGPHSCDPNGGDPYRSYATFLDMGNLITNDGSPLPFKPVFVPPIQELDQYGISANLDWKLSDLYSLKSITAWRRYDSTWAQDVDNSPLA